MLGQIRQIADSHPILIQQQVIDDLATNLDLHARHIETSVSLAARRLEMWQDFESAALSLTMHLKEVEPRESEIPTLEARAEHIDVRPFLNC